jgi:hypothetical protein
MNDLENDLRQVFERRAGDMGTSTEAPKQVLRRGRRRQVATALGGAVAAIGAVAVVIGVGAALLRNPTNQVPSSPVGTAPYGQRTATIQGVTVTAPAGWTLIDDWPFSTVIPSGSQTCSFSATGVPVNSSGDHTVASAVEPTSSCSGTVESLPAGVPILQLSNFQMPLGQTVCGLMDQPPATVPAEGVAIYVAQGTDGSMLITQSHDDLVASCPGASAMTTSFDAVGPGGAVGVLVAGPDASAGDLSIAQAVMDRFSTAAVRLSPPVSHEPGYVVVAGIDGGTPWRIEASTVFGRTPTVEAVAIVQDASGNDHADDVPMPADGRLVAATGRSIAADGTTLTWGTADANVSTLDIVADTGSWPATLVPWPPTGLADPATGTVPSGSIWWAISPLFKGDIRVTLQDGTTQILSGDDAAPTAASELPPAEFPGNLLAYGQEGGIGYVFGETNGGQPALLMGIGPDERSNPATFGWGRPSAWPTDRPLTFTSSNAAGGAVFGTVPSDVEWITIKTGDGRGWQVRSFQDLRAEFGGVRGWFLVVPKPAGGAGHLEATVSYYDGYGRELYQGDHLP